MQRQIKTEWELTANEQQLKNQFENRHAALMTMSMILILVGGFELLFGISDIAAPQGDFKFDLILIAFGMLIVILGYRGINIAGKKESAYPLKGIIAYRKKSSLAVSWFCFSQGLLASVLGFFFIITEDSMGVVWQLCAVLFFWIFIKTYQNCRNLRIIVSEGRIYGVHASGGHYTFLLSEVGSIKPLYSSYILVTRYIIYGATGKTLFEFDNQFVNAKLLFHVLAGNNDGCIWQPDDYQTFQKKQTQQWDLAQKSWQNDKVTAIRRWFYLLVGVNILLTMFLFFFCPNAWMAWKYRMLIVEFQPLCYLVYMWIFRDVIVLAHGRNVSREWKAKHISPVLAYIHGFLIFYFLTYGYYFYVMNFIEGTSTFYLMIVVLSLMLWGITALRMKRVPQMAVQFLAAAFIAVLLSIGISQATLVALSKSMEHYPADIIETRVSGGRDTSYYVKIKVKGYGKKEIYVTKRSYRDIQNGIPKVVCVRSAPWGIQFVYLHNE